MVEPGDGLDRTADVVGMGVVKLSDSRVFRVAAEDLLDFFRSIDNRGQGSESQATEGRHFVLIGLVDILDGNDGEVAVITKITERCSSSRLEASFFNRRQRDVQADGHAEKFAVCQTGVVDDSGRCVVSKSKCDRLRFLTSCSLSHS